LSVGLEDRFFFTKMKLIVILAFCLATAVYGKGLGDTLKVFQGIGPVIAGGQEAQAKVEEEAKQQVCEIYF